MSTVPTHNRECMYITCNGPSYKIINQRRRLYNEVERLLYLDNIKMALEQIKNEYSVEQRRFSIPLHN